METLLKCLICGLDNCSAESSLKSVENLSKNLHVIFILRNILEIPSEKLIVYLQNYPNLDSWLSVCDKCEGMVNDCRTIYQNMLTAQHQFRKVKQEIIQNINDSPFVKQEPLFNDDDDDEDNSDQLINNIIVDEIRQHVNQCEYAEITNPFISGDQLAYQHHHRSRNTHLKISHISPTKFKCSRCGITRDTQADLLLHQNNCKGLSFPCPLAPACQRRFIDRPGMLLHLSKIHGTDPNLPAQIRKLINDENEKKKEKKFNCSKTGAKIPNSKSELRKHPAKSLKVRPAPKITKCWTCPFADCGKIFKMEAWVNMHITKMHKGYDEPLEFICETCGAKFRKRVNLNDHLKKNYRCKMMRGEFREEDKVKCDICGNRYPSKAHMKRHRIKVHEKGMRKKCHLCEYFCYWQKKLDEHLWMKHKVGDRVGMKEAPNGKVEKVGGGGEESGSDN